eukprot:gene3864-4468_t
MNRSVIVVFIAVFVLGLQQQQQHVEAKSNVTVSGISSGAYIAVQYHVAYSSEIVGAGVVAGGPYYCANGNVVTAQTSCMADPDLISLDELWAATEYAEATFTIDSTSNLANTRVWMFSGSQDTVVHPGVVQKLEGFYGKYIGSDNLNSTFNVPAEHSFVTDNFGNECNYLGPDYINNCGYNTAHNLLSFLMPNIQPPFTGSLPGQWMNIEQASFIPFMTPLEAGLYESAYAYVASGCVDTTECSVHVAFHGCLQTVADINNTFYMNTGYNEVAETNNLIILYPQAQSNALNPKGCFDWWGFTGLDYASKLGVQMVTVNKMVAMIQSSPASVLVSLGLMSPM